MLAIGETAPETAMRVTQAVSVLIALLATGPLLAESADDLQDLVGIEHAKFDAAATASVKFAVRSAALTPVAQSVLSEMARALAANPDRRFEVAGHTDNSGAEVYNERLSEERANVVRQFLVSRGVAAERLAPVGYGPFQPIGVNDSDAGRALNRRVDLRPIN
jgi:outer membrane protein OmpA-like peptidoglycan-associated protein